MVAGLAIGITVDGIGVTVDFDLRAKLKDRVFIKLLNFSIYEVYVIIDLCMLSYN